MSRVGCSLNVPRWWTPQHNPYLLPVVFAVVAILRESQLKMREDLAANFFPKRASRRVFRFSMLSELFARPFGSVLHNGIY